MHPSLHPQTYLTPFCPIIDAIRMLPSIYTPLLPHPSRSPLHEPLHIVDDERRYSTSINHQQCTPSNPHLSLLSVLLPLPKLPPSQISSISELTHKNTITQPPLLLVLVSCSILLRLPVKLGVSILASVTVWIRRIVWLYLDLRLALRWGRWMVVSESLQMRGWVGKGTYGLRTWFLS